MPILPKRMLAVPSAPRSILSAYMVRSLSPPTMLVSFACRMVAPVVDEIAQQYEGKVKVVKLNTDENPNVASQYGIRSIPTLMIFKGGQRVDMVVGAVPKTTLANTLEKYI